MWPRAHLAVLLCLDLVLVCFFRVSIFTVRYEVNKTIWFFFFYELLPSNTAAFFGTFIMDNEVCVLGIGTWTLDLFWGIVGNFFPVL